MPLLSPSRPPWGTESGRNATLCGPPDTLMKRTIVPRAIVSALGSNAALLVPSPVMRTSTTGPVGVAGGAGAAAWPAWDGTGAFFSKQPVATMRIVLSSITRMVRLFEQVHPRPTFAFSTRLRDTQTHDRR